MPAIPSELNRIKQFRCPVCKRREGVSCYGIRAREVRIYPYAPGSSEDEWVHPARRNLAITAKVIPDSGNPTARGISIIRAIVMRKTPRKRNGNGK